MVADRLWPHCIRGSRGGGWGDRPPKTWESNFIHHDFLQLVKKHSRYKAILSSIALSQEGCEICYIPLRVAKLLLDVITKYYWNRPLLTLLTGSAPALHALRETDEYNKRQCVENSICWPVRIRDELVYCFCMALYRNAQVKNVQSQFTLRSKFLIIWNERAYLSSNSHERNFCILFIFFWLWERTTNLWRSKMKHQSCLRLWLTTEKQYVSELFFISK